MFRFFEGKFGELLAPVSNPLFLAIQHHRHDEVARLLQSGDCDVQRMDSGGYSAIHIACRYCNLYAIDLIMSKGKYINTHKM